MSSLAVVAWRGDLVESSHEVSAIVVDQNDRIIAATGVPDQTTFWRSAAKPFQVMPLVEDGGVERYHLDRQMLALACGSHNAEADHLRAAQRWLRALGMSEADLGCGGHPSLWSRRADEMIRESVTPSPLWSNCSGKHAALLGLAALHGWPTAGYQELGHPVQERVAATFARWSGVPVDQLRWGIDGCTAPAVALPLRAMAFAYARLGASAEAAAATLRDAMMAEPWYVAGSERVDTAIMKAWPGRVVVKAGAEGVFSAALPSLGIGLALKVHDGEMRAAALALVHLLSQITGQVAPAIEWPLTGLENWREPAVRNTRGVITGKLSVEGGLGFS